MLLKYSVDADGAVPEGLLAPAGIRIKGMPSGDNFIWSQEESARNLFHDQSFAERMLAHTPTDEEAGLAMRSRFMAAQLGWDPRWYNPALEHWLHRISVPTLLVYGDKDGLVPPAFGEAYRAAIPGSRFVLLKDAGHAPFDEQRDDFLQTLRNFIGNLAGR